ncbi:MAG: DUF1190 domain-containing protein [Dokdonella sp.]|uniref:DUF1190 domain-containing protein n=1 Tax=Dokdonella sp. TaxID=2291710 RepID=UPI003F7E350A
MKRSRRLALIAISQVPVLLAGCGEEEKLRQGFYTSIETCRSDGNSAQVCEKALQAAARAHADASPTYGSREQCMQDYGDLCTEREHGGGIWVPLMAGFMLSQVLGANRPPGYVDANPVYRDRAGRYSERYCGGDEARCRNGGAGYLAWRQRPVDITPNRAITTTRAGFGRSSSERSGWGRSFGG